MLSLSHFTDEEVEDTDFKQLAKDDSWRTSSAQI